MCINDISKIKNNLRAGNISWHIVQGLQKAGIREGDSIACVSDCSGAYWARLAKVRIRAEMWAPTENFWDADNVTKQEIINAFAKSNVKSIFTESIPPYAIKYAINNGWQIIDNTSHYILVHPKTGR